MLIRMTSFGDLLRQSRKDTDTKQLDLARHLGVQPTAVSNWETDKSQPSPEHCRAMQSLFGWSAGEIAIALGYAESSDRDESPRMSVVAAIEADPDLLDDHKQALKVHYRVLLNAAKQIRAGQAAGRPSADFTDDELEELARLRRQKQRASRRKGAKTS